MKRPFLAATVVLALAFQAAPAGAGFIQDAIDAAPTGAVIRIPAGVYEEMITLKDGVTLVGEGAGRTIIDGGGAEVVVSSAKNAALLGFTIRNGKTAVHSGGMLIGVFECVVTNYTQAGIRVEKGSAAIVNNLIDGGGRAIGVLAIESNPYVGHNVIAYNNVGLYAVQHLIPTVEHNVFHRNDTAIKVGGGAGVSLRNNIFSGNRVNIEDREDIPGNEIRDASEDELKPYTGAELAAYRSLMREVLEKASAVQPVVIYDLPPDPGHFSLAVCSSWATFRVAASAADSRLTAYDAYDSETDEALVAQAIIETDGRPAVDVNNPSKTERQIDRYLLEKAYDHPPSYVATPDGGRIFQRLTNLSRIEVRIPRGFTVAEANEQAAIEQVGDRQVVRMTEMGQTVVRVVLKPAH